ncbi:hypothetical protein Lqui_2945 [Legionella quinlivanii]|uniref:Uncharacterized protein n=1 Tax=Legionella quinlivanii TaxID=45073 RepID=A0A0W0XM80_9GAMM|nr:hypothetical protein [Legionella quinlivanii]KTD45474.1 hypothetical protein Lqui_2945 [Legionella quinlivanii]SEG32786.1 hypothetical protein SAMN02746093_02540 [Legionella quinlivanii DSM 21216]STY10566.1 Uncharacterised protein [Legionella quinlivanii]
MLRSLMPALLALVLTSPSALASPESMIIHNTTNLISNAFVDEMPGPRPTLPHSTSKVSWFIVQAGCRKHRAEVCPVVLKMGIDKAKPIIVGTLYIDITTGVITPVHMEGNGFKIDVDAPGEITISGD